LAADLGARDLQVESAALCGRTDGMDQDRSMSTDSWLSLTDYASKYRVSISTLRRRIKSGYIKYKFDGSRYWMQDQAPHAAQISGITEEVSAPPSANTNLNVASLTQAAIEGDERGEPILSTATRLLNELKRAYSGILHEKEEQMIQLKEEVSDLKTLVRVLESDNDRLRRLAQIRRDS
jgi:hypothetical protein